jgi:hypothetical protein
MKKTLFVILFIFIGILIDRILLNSKISTYNDVLKTQTIMLESEADLVRKQQLIVLKRLDLKQYEFLEKWLVDSLNKYLLKNKKDNMTDNMTDNIKKYFEKRNK